MIIISIVFCLSFSSFFFLLVAVVSSAVAEGSSTALLRPFAHGVCLFYRARVPTGWRGDSQPFFPGALDKAVEHNSFSINCWSITWKGRSYLYQMLKKSHNFDTIIIITSSSSSVSSSSRCPLTTYVPFVSPLRSPCLEHDHLPHPYLSFLQLFELVFSSSATYRPALPKLERVGRGHCLMNAWNFHICSLLVFKLNTFVMFPLKDGDGLHSLVIKHQPRAYSTCFLVVSTRFLKNWKHSERWSPWMSGIMLR